VGRGGRGRRGAGARAHPRALPRAGQPQPAAHRGGLGQRRLGDRGRRRVSLSAPRVAIAGVEREIALLPQLAPRLPLAIPDAAYAGAPGPRFGWPWFGSRLIAGREIAAAGLDDAARLALAPRLAGFLRALHATELPALAGLPVDPNRRTDMAARVPRTRAALAAAAAQGLWHPPEHVGALLDRAARLAPAQATVLVHGDLHVRHLLVDAAGELAGVIDWGDVCRAHPAADLSLYWSLPAPAGREAFAEIANHKRASAVVALATAPQPGRHGLADLLRLGHAQRQHGEGVDRDPGQQAPANRHDLAGQRAAGELVEHAEGAVGDR